jgi:hypothetical protein
MEFILLILKIWVKVFLIGATTAYAAKILWEIVLGAFYETVETNQNLETNADNATRESWKGNK